MKLISLDLALVGSALLENRLLMFSFFLRRLFRSSCSSRTFWVSDAVTGFLMAFDALVGPDIA